MTVKEYDTAYATLKKANKKSMHCDFRGQKPIEYLKIEVFAEEITRDAFRWQGTTLKDWNKNFIFLIGGLCGIDEAEFPVSEQLSKYAFISKFQVSRPLPDGSTAFMSAAYEYNAEIRADEVILQDEINNLSNPDNRKYKHEAQKNLLITQNAKYGRSKADTGAHKRATIKMLKFPKPESKLIGTTIFCFKCSPNFDNVEVRRRYLSSDNPADEIYGGTRQIEHHEIKDIEPTTNPTTEPNEEIINLSLLIHDKQEEMKEHSALYELAKIVSQKDDLTMLSEFLTFMEGYLDLGKQQRVEKMLFWVDRVETIPAEIKNGAIQGKLEYIKKWTGDKRK